MRILFDECVPRPLRRELTGHDIRTVQEMGWSGKKNGELLTLLIAAGFEVFLTTDQNMSYQQNMQAAQVALIAPSNRLADLLPLMPSVRLALTTIRPGGVVEIDA
jgi:PIN like domain